jgi:glycosyltransferase involved in cell wall biosynthesis
MTILFIHGIVEIGGAERELLMIVDRLARLGYTPVLVCPGWGPLGEELAKLGIPIRYAPLPPWRKVFAYPKRPWAIRRLRDVIVAARPSLVCVNDIWWVPQTLRATVGLQVPVVAYVRQEIEAHKVRRYELDRLHLVFPVSLQIQRSLENGGVPPDRLRTLYSGLDVSRMPQQVDGLACRRLMGIPSDVPLIGTVASLFPRKGYDVMLKAMPKILPSVRDTHYVIIGKGDIAYERALRSLVDKLGLSHVVHFQGFQENVYPFLAALDIYVHPALMEGFGIAVLEAMAMSKPVVATSVGGLPEIVQDGQTGVLVPPSDPDTLAQAVTGLLLDSSRRGEMGKKGRQRVETVFTADCMMTHLTAAYSHVTGKSGHIPSMITRSEPERRLHSRSLARPRATDMKLHCFSCATVVYPNDPEADCAYHSYYLKAQVAAFEHTGVQQTLIQNGCEFPSLGIPVLRNPIPKSLAYNYLVCDTNCAGDYWVFLPEDCRITPKGWEAIRLRTGYPCFSLAKDPKCLVCRKGVFAKLAAEIRLACDLNFLGKEISHMLIRGELEKQGFHSITPNWPKVSEHPPLWANEYLEMIPGIQADANTLRRMPTLDDYNISGYRASAAEIEGVYEKIVHSSLARAEANALACKSLVSHYGPLVTEVPYRPFEQSASSNESD